MGEIGMCTATLLEDPMAAGPDELRGAAEAAAEAGCTELSVWGFQLAAMGDLDALGLRVAVVEAAMTWPAGDPKPEADQIVSLAASVGASKIVAVTMEPTLPDLDRARENLGVLVDLAASAGAQVCVEFLPWSGIPDLATAWRLVEPLGPDAGILLDTWHWVRQPGGPAVDLLRTIPGERIGYVQVCDAAAGASDDVLDEAMTSRLLPGEGVVDFAEVFAVLGEIGASPFVATEIFNPGLVAEQGPVARRWRWSTPLLRVAQGDSDRVLRRVAAGEQRHRLLDVLEVEHLAGHDVGADLTRLEQRDRLRHRVGREARATEDPQAVHHQLVAHEAGDLLEVLEPGEEDGAAEAHEVERQRHGLHGGRHVEHHVGAHATGEVAHGGHRVVTVDDDRLRRADVARRGQPEVVLRRARHHHDRRLGRQHRLEHGEALVARALHHDGGALGHPGDVDPVDGVGQRLEDRELGGRRAVGQHVEAGAGEDLHVLAVAAPQADLAGAGHVAVAVDAHRRERQDLVDGDPVALGHAELGVRRQRHDPPDRLVPGHDRERAATGDQLDAVELGDVAAAQADGLDL
jgi:sugar phosphate isomerase/epimerase